MKTVLTAAAVAAMLLAGPALAANPATTPDAWTKMKAVPASAETCQTAEAKFNATEKAHPGSANLAKAKAEAKTAASDCKAGKSADGIAAYDAAIKLLKA
ncbi:MAG: hypothetical protein QM698_13055 [Micropepsaceae bacterium]